MPPPAYVLYVGREFVRRGFQTAHRHGRCNVRNEHRAKKCRQSDERYSDVFHGEIPPFLEHRKVMVLYSKPLILNEKAAEREPGGSDGENAAALHGRAA